MDHICVQTDLVDLCPSSRQDGEDEGGQALAVLGPGWTDRIGVQIDHVGLFPSSHRVAEDEEVQALEAQGPG
jgi:hypothetical protein